MFCLFNLYLHPLIIEFLWFTLLRLRIQEKIYTKALADVFIRGGVWNLFYLAEGGANELPGKKGGLGGTGGETDYLNYFGQCYINFI